MRKIAVVGALLFLGGCPSKTTTTVDDGGTAGDGGGGGGDMTTVPPLTYDEFTTTLAATYCDFVFKCCTNMGERTGYAFGATTAAECKTLFPEKSLMGCTSDVATSKVTFNATAGATCLAAAKAGTMACSSGIGAVLSGLATACSAAITSNANLGDACPVCTSQCKDTAKTYCDFQAKKCAAYVAKDGDCTGDKQCDPATKQYCDTTSNKCINFVATGSDCSTGVCDSTKDWCDSQGTGNCTARGAIGAACDPSLAGTDCLSGSCDTNTMKCKAEVVPPAMCTG